MGIDSQDHHSADAKNHYACYLSYATLIFVGPKGYRPRRGKILDLHRLVIIAPSSKSVQSITSDASQTHITIHSPKAHDTFYPLHNVLLTSIAPYPK